MIITYRNPQQLDQTLDVYFDIVENNFTQKWKQELVYLLEQNYHLEKNYCFLGFVQSPRNINFICNELNSVIKQINNFNALNIWQQSGLENYHITDYFTKESVMHSENLPIGSAPGVIGNEENFLGCRIKQESMNRLHRYFEDLQGEAWGLSNYYKIADNETKYAIRQLNDLCHELESYIESFRKSKYEPQWQRPSQIMTWLQAPRKNLSNQDYELFLQNRYDRVCGGVYLHWAQVGKTHIEVFRDENGKDIDSVTCSSISSLQYYSGEFDIEWGKDVTRKTAPWHVAEQDEFNRWLKHNGFDPNDSKLALGFIKLGQCNLEKSFGTTDPQKIWNILSQYLDVYTIQIGNTKGKMPYVWSQSDFKQKQIEIMKPGYIWSSQQ